MSSRIPCINPLCRRTAAQDKFPGSTQIICGKCWRAVPDRIRRRWKQLKTRWKRLERAMRKNHVHGETWSRVVDRLESAWDRLDADVVHYFTTSETPAGIEDFLKENGIG